ncbi:hypothetical protein IC006_0540 [Sulfuracidifex tepidarius]|uniref:Uncharacterized protein n=1 Tax=Sulfuracidifex tepidarius TaxID=1294262 RepID=A0A510DSS3_9CREN|nr:hypothetical protein IC006_0540 [Sulfuracidifex tepidarius]
MFVYRSGLRFSSTSMSDERNGPLHSLKRDKGRRLPGKPR